MTLLFGAYLWAMTSGYDRLMIEQGRSIYQAIIRWFDDAEVDFQINRSQSKTKKKSRRWD